MGGNVGLLLLLLTSNLAHIIVGSIIPLAEAGRRSFKRHTGRCRLRTNANQTQKQHICNDNLCNRSRRKCFGRGLSVRGGAGTWFTDNIDEFPEDFDYQKPPPAGLEVPPPPPPLAPAGASSLPTSSLPSLPEDLPSSKPKTKQHKSGFRQQNASQPKQATTLPLFGGTRRQKVDTPSAPPLPIESIEIEPQAEVKVVPVEPSIVASSGSRFSFGSSLSRPIFVWAIGVVTGALGSWSFLRRENEGNEENGGEVSDAEDRDRRMVDLEEERHRMVAMVRDLKAARRKDAEVYREDTGSLQVQVEQLEKECADLRSAAVARTLGESTSQTQIVATQQALDEARREGEDAARVVIEAKESEIRGLQQKLHASQASNTADRIQWEHDIRREFSLEKASLDETITHLEDDINVLSSEINALRKENSELSVLRSELEKLYKDVAQSSEAQEKNIAAMENELATEKGRLRDEFDAEIRKEKTRLRKIMEERHAAMIEAIKRKAGAKGGRENGANRNGNSGNSTSLSNRDTDNQGKR